MKKAKSLLPPQLVGGAVVVAVVAWFRQ